MYEEWSKRSKKEIGRVGETEGDFSLSLYDDNRGRSKFKHHQNKKAVQSELKSFDQVAKERKVKTKRREMHQANRKRKLDKSFKGGKGGGGRPQKKRKI